MPDFSIVQRVWEERLREVGLSPAPRKDGLATGYQRLEIYRKQTEVAELSPGVGGMRSFIASLEVQVVVEHPTAGNFEVWDRVTQWGDSSDAALRNCAVTFLDVTFAVLQSLLAGEARKPRAYNLALTSYTGDIGRAIQWTGFISPHQLLNDQDGIVAKRLADRPPFSLIFDTLTGQLANLRTHWCKIYGGHHAHSDQLNFGCSIDGQKSAEAEAEMSRKFGDAIPGDWEFRQFLIVQPIGEATDDVANELRDRATEQPEKAARKGFWSRLLRR